MFAVVCLWQVRETSRRSLIRASNLVPAAKKTLEAVKRDFSDIILPGGLHDRVRSLAAAAANTKLHGAPYRHMLFYGAWEKGDGGRQSQRKHCTSNMGPRGCGRRS